VTYRNNVSESYKNISNTAASLITFFTFDVIRLIDENRKADIVAELLMRYMRIFRDRKSPYNGGSRHL
jgi:hypothetical protein